MFKNVKFDTYIYRVLKQVHPNTGMTGDSLSMMNNLVRIVLQRIVQTVNRVMVSTAGRKTVSSREIQTAVRLALPGELSKHSVTQGTTAVTKYISAKKTRSEEAGNGKKAKPVLRATMAGLTFPVTRIENIMIELSNAERKSETSAVFLAAVLEYITAEVLELAGNAARDNKKIRVTPRHIKLAILNDTELEKLFRGVVLSGGVLPHIEPSLIKAKAESNPPKKRVVKKKTTTKPPAKKASTKPPAKKSSTKPPAKNVSGGRNKK